MHELLKAAYAEGAKTALMDVGHSQDDAYQMSEKVAQEPRGTLERVMTGAPVGASLGVLAGGALGLGRTPIMRRELMRLLKQKESGGLWKALTEVASNPANKDQIRNLAIPGAVGGGAIGAISGT